MKIPGDLKTKQYLTDFRHFVLCVIWGVGVVDGGAGFFLINSIEGKLKL